METSIEENIKILGETIKGDEDCLRIDLANDNTEDVEHWKREIEAIKAVVNSYYREKARADKLEKEYSKMLTKIDECEADDKANKYDALVKKMNEKLEELIQKLKEVNNDRWEKDDNAYYNKIKAQIKVLQELIPEEE